jgi:undecaprenyl-diphosphatase
VFAAVLLLVAYLVLTGIWAALGLLVTGPFAGSWVGSVDQDVTGWLVALRTPVLNDWSRLGTMPADTRVKIVVTAVVSVVMFIGWRSWREPLLVCFALILEAAVFITVTGIVGRARPGVAQLDQVSVDTSFPSGHAAAAAAYCAIAIVIFERTRNRWVRAIAVVVAVGLPVIVGLCRMYRGVHYLTDVIAGILLGVVCAVTVYAIIRRCLLPGSERHRSAPEQSPRPDPR